MTYTSIIVLCFIAVMIADFVVEWLNVRHMKAAGCKVPEGFGHVVDEETMGKTIRYTVSKERVAFLSSVIMGPLSLYFIFGGILPVYDKWTVAVAPGFVTQSLLFIVVMSYVAGIISIPFEAYSTFVVEKAFGFNNTTVGLWIKDGVKNTILSLVLAVVLYGGIFAVVKGMPNVWWILGWGLFATISMLMMIIYPTIIAPLFNKFEPIEGGDLEERIKETAKKAGVSISQVVKMDASKRSGHSNAYFSGIGKAKKVVLYDTLIDQLTTDELVAVLAHEFGHLKKKHIVKMLISMNAFALIGFYLVYWGVNNNIVSQLLGYEELSFAAQGLVILILSSLATFPVKPIMNWLSRRKEKEADRFAVELTGENEHLASALIKLSAENLSNLYPHPVYAFMTYSHPPVVDRVSQIRSYAP